LREALLRGVDGVTLYFNRGAPYAFYEEPTVASFINIHGEDPRNLPISDKRWVEHCGSYVTLFLREVRALLDEQPGRELAVIFNTALFGSTDPAEVHKYYFDVDGWIEESLVDVLMPTKSVDTRWLQQWRASSGAKLKIWPDLRPRTMPGDYYVRLAQRYYEAGADGFCFWDGERRPPRISEWATARYLGHRDCLDDLELEAKGHFHRHQLDTLNGLAVPLSFRDG